MSSQGRKVKYELWVRVECPHCLLASGGKKSIKVQTLARGLPKTLRCFSCGGAIDTEDLYERGQEILHRASSECIKGVDKKEAK